MKNETKVYQFDGMEILVSEQYNSRAAYNDIMQEIRGWDVDDILRESPAFTEETEH